jgi:peptidoglycan/LPS O-acetylase OafA/YrhL
VDKGEIRSLTTLRGVAALAVALFHTPTLFGVRSLLPHAYLAVDFFFLLSGFVLTHAYAGRIAGGLSLWQFTRARFARLYPLYAVATLLGAGLVGLRVLAHALPADGQGLANVLRGLLFAPAPASPINADGAAYPFLTQGWSVAWEVVGGSLLFLWGRMAFRAPLGVVAGALGVLVIVVWRRGSLDGGWVDANFAIGGVRALFGFSAGVAVRRILLPWLAEAPAAVQRATGVAALVFGLATLAYVAAGETSPVAELALVIYGFPLIVAACALERRRWLEPALGVAVGRASYSLYLLHVVAGLASVMVLARLPHIPALALHLLGPLWMAALVGGSWLSWRWLEEPARRALTPAAAPRRTLRSALSGAMA